MSSRFVILNSCSKKWNDLRGDGRERYCDVCGTSVHAMAQYSCEEWDQIWRNSGGHVCALISGESPPVPRSRRAILAGALLTAISPLMAQAGRVRIRVIDKNGAAIATAVASLVDAAGKPMREAHADEKGEIVLTDLQFGNCRFAVFADGFNTRTVTATLTNGDVSLRIALDVGSVGGPIVVETQSEKMSSALAPPPKRARKRWWVFW